MRRQRALACSGVLLVVAGACASTPPPATESAPIVVPVASVPPLAPSAQPSIQYDFPRAADWTGLQVVFAIDVAANGELRVNGAPIEEEKLKDAAREAQARSPELRAVIRADSSVTYGRVIRVMDLLKQAGISRIAFGVSPIGK
jgi:biopolymer transport protein ExbD